MEWAWPRAGPSAPPRAPSGSPAAAPGSPQAAPGLGSSGSLRSPAASPGHRPQRAGPSLGVWARARGGGVPGPPQVLRALGFPAAAPHQGRGSRHPQQAAPARGPGSPPSPARHARPLSGPPGRPWDTVSSPPGRGQGVPRTGKSLSQCTGQDGCGQRESESRPHPSPRLSPLNLHTVKFTLSGKWFYEFGPSHAVV